MMNFFVIILTVLFVLGLVTFSVEDRFNRWRSKLKLRDSRRDRRRGKGKRGRPGPIGPPGNPGPPGLPGRDGQQGIPGISGETGLPGDIGLPGNRGLKGLKGDRGDKGERGRAGVPGRACYIEKKGVEICISPSSGPEGPPGAKGSTGAMGDKGDPGIPGSKGNQGDMGPRGLPGKAVDAINIRCYTRHNKLTVAKEHIVDNLDELIHAHCDPLQFLQGMKMYKDSSSIKLTYTCCSFY